MADNPLYRVHVDVGIIKANLKNNTALAPIRVVDSDGDEELYQAVLFTGPTAIIHRPLTPIDSDHKQARVWVATLEEPELFDTLQDWRELFGI